MFENEPEKRKLVLNELKDFTETGDMYKLTSKLNSVLKTPQHRILLNEIKQFIPSKQQALFENLTSKSSSSLIMNPMLTVGSKNQEPIKIDISSTTNSNSESNSSATILQKAKYLDTHRPNSKKEELTSSSDSEHRFPTHKSSSNFYNSNNNKNMTTYSMSKHTPNPPPSKRYSI